jgi:uncharacterized repeat protein (TIGR03803 family)
MTSRGQCVAIAGPLLPTFLAFFSCAAAQTSTLVLTTIYSFTGGADGAYPTGGVTIGGGGVLYGTTQGGGYDVCQTYRGCGTVFSLTPSESGDGAWTQAVLYEFGTPYDGVLPWAGVVVAPNGVLYGTTLYGGFNDSGTVFNLNPPASPDGAWTEGYYRFKGGPLDGSSPYAGVIRSGETIYGATQLGGTWGYGTVFSLTPSGETVLYNFTGGSDGGLPTAGLAMGQGGALYGTTAEPDPYNNPVAGAVYSLAPPQSPGATWTETVLHRFEKPPGGPAWQFGKLVIGPGGTLYGTTELGGSSGWGTVFSLTPPLLPGGAWTENVLYNFTLGSDGGVLEAGVVIGSGGVLYGATTYSDSVSYCGTLFSLTPPALPGGAWTETTLYSFTGGSDGCFAYSLAIGPGGTLYGTTYGGGASSNCLGEGCGTVFSLTP